VWDRAWQRLLVALSTGAAGNGFWWRKQAALVEQFVAPFFDGLAPSSPREAEAARAIPGVLPKHRIDEDLRGRIAEVLAGSAVGPMLRRMLLEEDDDLRRAIACRAVAAAAVTG
jgi:aminopeptidase N